MKSNVQSHRAFTLVELLAVIAIMAVLIVAALPYVANYTLWAQATAEQRDAQVVAGAIARWIALGADTTEGSAANPNGNSQYNWQRGTNKLTYPSAWTNGSVPAGVIEDLVYGWTVINLGTANPGSRDPFISPSTSFTQLGKRVKIAFTDARHWTVTGRTTMGFGF